MTTQHPALYAFALAAVVVICATILAALHDVVPDWFAVLAGVGGGGGAGIAIPAAANRARSR